MKGRFRLTLILAFLASPPFVSPAFSTPPPILFRALVLGSNDPYHSPMVNEAQPLFEAIAAEGGFAVDFTRDAGALNDSNLSRYQVVVQLHFAPFDLTNEEQDSLQRFIELGG